MLGSLCKLIPCTYREAGLIRDLSFIFTALFFSELSNCNTGNYLLCSQNIEMDISLNRYFLFSEDI